MGSVCEFSDNFEQAKKAPPQMQMQASKLQSPQLVRHNILNQQFIAINKDTGEMYDLSNPESASELVGRVVKASEQLRKNRLPWEEWWKQKKQNNVMFLVAAQQNDFLTCSDLLNESRGDLKAETNFTDLQTGWAPLHFAVLNQNIHLVSKLIVNEANINLETFNQVTPLMIAAEQGSEEIVILLLKANAEINYQDENGNSALHIACLYDKLSIIEILVQRFKPDLGLRNKQDKLCFELARGDSTKKWFEYYFSTSINNPVQLKNDLIQRNNGIREPTQLRNQVISSTQIINNTNGFSYKQLGKQFIETSSKCRMENNYFARHPRQDNNFQPLKQPVQLNQIPPKRQQSAQIIPGRFGDYLSPTPRPNQENRIKTLSGQFSFNNKQPSICKFPSKNGTPKSRENSKQNSFFQMKGQKNTGIQSSSNGKENSCPLKNANSTQKRKFQTSRPSSTVSSSISTMTMLNNHSMNFSANPFPEQIAKYNSIQSINLQPPGSNYKSFSNGIIRMKANLDVDQLNSAKPIHETTSEQISKFVLPASDFSEGLENDKVTIHSFIIHSLLGKGSFGDVYLVQKKDSFVFYAMKVLQKSKMMKSNVIKYALTERNVLSMMKHPFIVKLNYSFQTEEKLFLILDFASAGDMGRLLQRVKTLSESHARLYLAEILLALQDLHKQHIIFRDLKPDNIVIDSEGHALLTDFGLSKEGVQDYTEGAQSFCGSIAYLAPEMLKRRGHGKGVDWYLFGVVMYEMLTGNPPYYANTKEDLFANIERATLFLPEYLSDEAKSLLAALLERDPAMRLGCGRNDANDIKNHPFFKGVEWDQIFQRKGKAPEVPLLPLSLNNYNSELFIQNLIGLETNLNDKHISGWSFVANNDPNAAF